MDNTITRLGFEKAMKDARAAVVRATDARATLFRDLCDPSPRVARLDEHALRLSESTAAAERAFSTLFAINAQSVPALRLFAQFNEMGGLRAPRPAAATCAQDDTLAPALPFPSFTVINNTEKAEAVAAEADRLEEQGQKSQRASAGGAAGSVGRSRFFVPAALQLSPGESTGVVCISTALSTAGQITFVSQAACRMLGFTRAQLHRRDVSVIIPSPISEAQ